MADKMVEYLVASAVQRLRVKAEEQVAPTPRPAPAPDPHLEQTIARLEAVVAERQPEIDKVEAERAAAVGDLEALLIGIESNVTSLAQKRDDLSRAAASAALQARMEIDDAERRAEEILAEARERAASIRACARALAAEREATAAESNQEAAVAGSRYAAARALYDEQRKRLDTVTAPFDEQLARLRRGKYGEAVKRLPDLRARRARRGEP